MDQNIDGDLGEFGAHTAALIADVDSESIPDDVSFVLEQQVTRDDQLVGNYHLAIGGGNVRVVPGPAINPDVTLRQDEATARALQDGTLHAQGAFLTGRLSIDGDINALLEHGELLTKLLNTANG